MRFPVSVVKTFQQAQRNFDYLTSWFQSFSMQNVTAVGPWPIANPPNGTTGLAFTVKRDCKALLYVQSTGYAFTTTAGAINVSTYLDGTFIGNMFLNASTPNPPAHTVLTPIITVLNLKAGTHYVYFQQTLNNADGNDLAQVTIITMPQ